METNVNPAPVTVPQTDELPNETLNRSIFKIENITIVRPPLLKIYYWESLEIESLNKKLLSQTNCIEHHLELPVRQLYSNNLKIVFWFRNLSSNEYTMQLKRIQNCECTPIETRVGFNQFRHLYHCPHRRLIYISQETLSMQPHDLLAVSMMFYYFILGTYTLSYELRVSDGRSIKLHFHISICNVDPAKSVLTTNMIPVNIKEHRCMSQPLWIRNITRKHVPFCFSGKNRGLRLINSNMTIPPQSVWPLIVTYKPSDFENNLELFLRYGEKGSLKYYAENHYKIPITCKGFMEEDIENCTVPILDYECDDYPYVVYPNRLEFTTELYEERTLMVAVHNYDEKCMEFRWQTNVCCGFSSSYADILLVAKTKSSVKFKQFDNIQPRMFMPNKTNTI